MKKFLPTFFLIAVALIPMALFAEENKFVSEYSSLQNCKVLEKSEQCQSHDGYSVFYQDMHVNSQIILKKNAKEIPLPFDGQLFRPAVAGKQLEWRYQLKGGRKNLVALIYRMDGHEREAYDKGDYKIVSILYVARITDITEPAVCIVGRSKTNEEARKIADSNSPCQK